jgi:hypothetical protein
MSSDYCTQIAPSGSGGMRCGAASCASVLLSEGWQSDPWALTLQLDAQCDPTKDGTTSQDLLTLMDGYGFPGGLWSSWDDLDELMRNGLGVLLLCDNRHLVPRPYPAGAAWEAMHWVRIVATSVPDGMAYVYDPLTYLYQPDGSAYQGPTVATLDSLKAAGDVTGYPEYGVAFVSPTGRDLNK